MVSEQHSPARGGQDGPAQDLPARAPVDLGRVIAEQERIFTQRQPQSARMAARARDSLAGGVTSSWQITAPQPVWLSHGRGSKIYDVDGNEYVDLHGGYGAGLAGHAHPAIVEAVRGQVAPRHPFRPAHRGRDRGRRGARPAVRPAAVALRQLRHRGDDGRRPPDAGDHRARPDHQGRGLLPRPPRLGAGLGHARAGRGRAGRTARADPGQHRHPGRDHPADARRRLQRSRQRRPAPRRASRASRRNDHRADHDERGHHPRPSPATWQGSRTCSTPTARCSPSTRSRPA